MKRELKFRYVFQHGETGRIVIKEVDIETIEDSTIDLKGFDIVARLQYTGLDDKNEKNIYEGDIVDCSGTKYICEWNIHRAEYAWKTLSGDYIYPIGDCRTELEVIGNIYENPELIK